MKLSHIHEDKAPSLTDILNEKKIYPIVAGGSALIEPYIYRHLKLMLTQPDAPDNQRRTSIDDDQRWAWPMADYEISTLFYEPRQGYSQHGVEPIKTIWRVEIEYEQTPESENPLDNIEDEFGEDFIMLVAVVEGAGQFEGQFAWYNENLIGNRAIEAAPTQFGHEQVLPNTETRIGLCWLDGKPPKIPRQHKRSGGYQ